MSILSSCLGRRGPRLEDEEALIPVYEDDTALQRKLHEKMHTYQMIRALTRGFMPSNDQLIIQIRTLLAFSDLDSSSSAVSGRGRRLVHHYKQWMHGLIDFLREKNSEDEMQDCIWYMLRASKVIYAESLDMAKDASLGELQGNASTAYQSALTVGDLLLSNSDFRLFIDDLGLLGRQVFADAASSLSDATAIASDNIKLSSSEREILENKDRDHEQVPEDTSLEGTAKIVGENALNALDKAGKDAVSSAKDNLDSGAKEELLLRLQNAVKSLRQKPDYESSVNILLILLKHYVSAYSRPVEHAATDLQENVRSNEVVRKAFSALWSTLRSFGNEDEWDRLRKCFDSLAQCMDESLEIDGLLREILSKVQSMLLDPEFFDNVDKHISELQRKMDDAGSGQTEFLDAVRQLIHQSQRTWTDVANDHSVHKLVNSSLQLFGFLFSEESWKDGRLLQDALNVFIPTMIQAIQHIPLPRLEISTPEIDLLLENLILEPGRTVNNSSFLPFRLKLETLNNVEIRKARFRTHSSVESSATIKFDGLTVSAEEIGYWTRARLGCATLSDEGIASFHLDERGMDIHLDVEICQERMEKIVTLRDVHVKIHHLNYILRKSKLSWLAWLLKPLLRPILRRTMEKQTAEGIKDFFHAANRELLYARERLRATRIAEPSSLLRFVKAIVARLTPEDDPDLFTAFGVRPSDNPIFRGRYAPGSSVKLWEEEIHDISFRLDDAHTVGWRSEIYDVHAVAGN